MYTIGKEHGITKEEAVEIVTQLTLYCGWPIQEIYMEESK